MIEMSIDLYAVDHGYGFCQDDGLRCFFRIEDFRRLSPDGPLPICGEPVSVESVVDGGKSPRASALYRQRHPQLLRGQVKSFDSNKGWGFVTHGGETYFLHKSDLTTPFTPIIGSYVQFYAGVRRKRKRACYVSPDGG